MRVIAGSAGSLMLKAPRGETTRPTTDKIKETLFNIIAADIYEARFLDLFAGSGGIGIEALSRGAGEAVFADISRAAVNCIKENLRHTKLSCKARVLHGSYEKVLNLLDMTGEKFDVIFLDPPYKREIEDKCLDILLNTGLIDGETLVIIEEDIKTDTEHLSKNWIIDKIKLYKSNKHIFLHKRGWL